MAWLEAERPDWLAVLIRPSAPALADERLRLDGVSFSYGNGPAVRRASLTVRRGEIVALEGPNGSGKTTVAKLAAGLLEPSTGTIERRGRAGYLSQDRAGTSSARRRWTRWRSLSAATVRGHGRRLHASASAGRRRGIRATSRAASASGSASQPLPSHIPTC